MKLKKWVALATAAAMCLSMTACSVSVSTNETTKAAEPTPLLPLELFSGKFLLQELSCLN